MWINVCFHPLLFANIMIFYQDKQLLALILQLGAIKLLQKKRAQGDDVIKWAPVKPQTVVNDIEDMMEI